MNKTGWIIFGGVTALVLGGLITWNYLANPPLDVSYIKTNEIIAPLDQNGSIADHTKGSKDGKILLVEYGDFQCPGCAGAYANVNQLSNEYKDSVTLIFRNFPLTSIHPNSKAAASAAEAAGMQGKYWEMHDIIYQQQSAWSNADPKKRLELFQQYAVQLKLDTDKFKADIESNAVAKKIRFDLAVGKKAGVSATPTFFLNGEKLDDKTANGIVQGDLTGIKEKLDSLKKKLP